MHAPMTKQNWEQWQAMVDGGMDMKVAFEHMTNWAAMLEARLGGFDENYMAYPWGRDVEPLVPPEKPRKSLLQNFRDRVYEWKAQHHSWSDVPTLQIIGCAKALLLMKCPYGVPVIQQTAQVAKNFCTDEMLKSWGMYNSGMRHARDAVRHGTYFLLFGPSKDQST